MKRNSFFFLLSLMVIFSLVVGLTTNSASASLPGTESTSLGIDLTSGQGTASLPRNNTLYFNGLQWGPVLCWNPYSSNCNNAMAITQGASARVTMFETPYLYDMLTGEQIPLLADGPYLWNESRTAITFKIKPTAHWRDGSPVTAYDVAYTWATNVIYDTDAGLNYKNFIYSIVAIDPRTVLVAARLDGSGKAINPLMLSEYLSSNYVVQKAWTQRLEVRSAATNSLKDDPAEDVTSSGPYYKYFNNDQMVVLVRDDHYWGKDASMWGRSPVPKYLAHFIYPDNDSSLAAFKAGEVDVSQMFIANVQDLWLVEGLPVSTYLPEAPYQVGASLPTAFYNLSSYGLDQIAVRQAIAMAVNYDAVVANAMTNQSATFEQVPRSLMIPTPGEQAMYDHSAVADLQWTGNDIEGAKALLDTAGIVDGPDDDNWREYNGQNLHYVATCPDGWSDWMAAIELVAAAGQAIGIDISAEFYPWDEYQNIVTNWSSLSTTPGYDIFMMWSDGAGPAQPWNRIRHMMSSEFNWMDGNWNGNWGGYSNPTADYYIQAIPGETDPALLKADYTELVRIYLTEVPSFTLMYRPQSFQTVNESIWTNFPHLDDGTNPPVPPLDLIDGYSIAGLYNLKHARQNP